MSVSTIENQSPPTTRNQPNARSSILRQIGLCNATNRPKIKPRTRVEDLVAGRPIARLELLVCLLYTSPSPRDQRGSRMPSSA